MKHPLLISVAALALIGLSGDWVLADQVDFSLNLLFSDPSDDQSGGDWELVARSDVQGIAGVSVRLTGIVDPAFHTPRGEVAGSVVGFLENFELDFGNHLQLGMAQIPQDLNLDQPLFYDVGVIGGGTMPGDNGTPSFAFDMNTTRSIPWGRPDSLGDASWDGAVLLASGLFNPATSPAFFSGPAGTTRGVVFTAVGDEFTPGPRAEAMVTTVVRNNLMTPGIMGDYNSSGTVEQGDLDLVLLNWGQDGTTPPTGWVHDLPSGLIDQEELDGVLLNWGNMAAGALGGAQAVPEPSTLLLLSVAVALHVAATKVGWQRTSST